MINFSNIFFKYVTAVGMLLILPGVGHCAEEILLYRSEIKVHSDSSLSIIETIRVRSAGWAIKRGIYRDFPTDYRDSYGNKYNVRFNVEEVLRDGRRDDFHVTHYKNGVRVYIGNKNHFLIPGVYTYTLKYTTDRQLGFFKDHDELYFNAIGHGWKFPIREAEAIVSLPSEVPSREIKFDGFSGRQGLRLKDFTANFVGSKTVRYKVNKVLQPSEGLTVVVSWPKGFVTAPTLAKSLEYFFSDNLSSLIGILGLGFLVFCYYRLWKKYGEDPEKGTVIPLFRPPDNLSPAAMRYVMNRGEDKAVFAAAVISLAAKGALTIQNMWGVFTLSKKVGANPKLSPDEQILFSNLFLAGDKLKLKDGNHAIISDSFQSMSDVLDKTHRKTDFFLHRRLAGLGVLVTLVILGLMWAVDAEFLVRVANIVILIAFIIVIAIFFKLLEAPTRKGRALMDKIEGFKMYLGTAEGEELDKMHPPEKTPQLFEKYLPYAIALGVENRWSEKFRDVLAAASVGGAVATPIWYQSSSLNPYADLSDSIGSSLGSAIASSSVAPGSSSGGGGGGFSGGGGGGGGGGGW